MSEVIFILTTVFVAYVVYRVTNDDKASNNTVTPAAETPENPVEESVTEPEVVSKSEEKEESVEENSLRDPNTGEIAKIPNNYRFSKRWIKEALVTEGLLEKIYKNSELNDDSNAKIKAALEQLKTIEKYQV